MAEERALIMVLQQMVHAGFDDDSAGVFLRGFCRESGQSPSAMASALAAKPASFEGIANPFVLSIVKGWIEAASPPDDRAENHVDLRGHEDEVDRRPSQRDCSPVTIDLTDGEASDEPGTQSRRRAARLWQKISHR